MEYNPGGNHVKRQGRSQWEVYDRKAAKPLASYYGGGWNTNLAETVLSGSAAFSGRPYLEWGSCDAAMPLPV